MDSKNHWQNVYETKNSTAVSWFQEHANLSLELIQQRNIDKHTPIIDVGGGASTLVDDLLTADFQALTVLDLAASALTVAQTRLGQRSYQVTWLAADITRADLPSNHYGLWHDRAVFHFLTTPEQRKAYVQQVEHALQTGGYLLMATFALDGPLQCSGLPIVRYSPETLQAELGTNFVLREQRTEAHLTPSGSIQHFVYCLFQKQSDAQQ